MTRLRKDQAETLVAALESATSGPLEEITMIRGQLLPALQIVLDRPTDGWTELITAAAARDGWDEDRTAVLQRAAAPDRTHDTEAVLWALWDLVTELNERRSLD